MAIATVQRAIILKATSTAQLDYAIKLIQERLEDFDDEQFGEEYASEAAALFNLLCDMNVVGYEI